MAADVIHVALHVPYLASAVLWAVVLTAVFVAWFRVEATLSVHDIDTCRREAFYWAAVVSTQATQNFPTDKLGALRTITQTTLSKLQEGNQAGATATVDSSRRRGMPTSPPSNHWTRRRGPSSTAGSTPCCTPCAPRPRTTPPNWPPCKPWPSRSADRRSPYPSCPPNVLTSTTPGWGRWDRGSPAGSGGAKRVGVPTGGAGGDRIRRSDRSARALESDQATEG